MRAVLLLLLLSLAYGQRYHDSSYDDDYGDFEPFDNYGEYSHNDGYNRYAYDRYTYDRYSHREHPHKDYLDVEEYPDMHYAGYVYDNAAAANSAAANSATNPTQVMTLDSLPSVALSTEPGWHDISTTRCPNSAGRSLYITPDGLQKYGGAVVDYNPSLEAYYLRPYGNSAVLLEYDSKSISRWGAIFDRNMDLAGDPPGIGNNALIGFSGFNLYWLFDDKTAFDGCGELYDPIARAFKGSSTTLPDINCGMIIMINRPGQTPLRLLVDAFGGAINIQLESTWTMLAAAVRWT